MSITELIAQLAAAGEGSRELDAEIAVVVQDMNDPAFLPADYVVPPTYEIYHAVGFGLLIAARVTTQGHSIIVCSREPRPYTVSLDAALTVVPRDCRWMMGRLAEYWAAVYRQEDRDRMSRDFAPTPPLALLIAALRSRIS